MELPKVIMELPKVESMGNNQFLIKGENYTAFQSYDSIIAIHTAEGTYLDEFDWDYSKTTGKFRNMFLGESKKETERKIRDGKYKLTNLN